MCWNNFEVRLEKIKCGSSDLDNHRRPKVLSCFEVCPLPNIGVIKKYVRNLPGIKCNLLPNIYVLWFVCDAIDNTRNLPLYICETLRVILILIVADPLS